VSLKRGLRLAYGRAAEMPSEPAEPAGIAMKQLWRRVETVWPHGRARFLLDPDLADSGRRSSSGSTHAPGGGCGAARKRRGGAFQRLASTNDRAQSSEVSARSRANCRSIGGATSSYRRPPPPRRQPFCFGHRFWDLCLSVVQERDNVGELMRPWDLDLEHHERCLQGLLDSLLGVEADYVVALCLIGREDPQGGKVIAGSLQQQIGNLDVLRSEQGPDPRATRARSWCRAPWSAVARDPRRRRPHRLARAALPACGASGRTRWRCSSPRAR